MRDKWRKKRVRRLKRKRRKMRARSKVRLPAVVHSEPIPRRTHVPVLPPAVNDSRRYLLATRSTTTPRCDLPLAGPRDPPSTTKCTARSTTLDELPIPPNIRSSASTFDQRQYPVPRTSGRSGVRQLGGTGRNCTWARRGRGALDRKMSVIGRTARTNSFHKSHKCTVPRA